MSADNEYGYDYAYDDNDDVKLPKWKDAHLLIHVKFSCPKHIPLLQSCYYSS